MIPQQKPTNQEVLIAEAARIALQLQPQLQWFDPMQLAAMRPDSLARPGSVQLPYAICGYYGVSRTVPVEDTMLTVPKKHHRVLTGVTPPRLDRELFRSFPVILHRAALSLGAPEGDGLITEQTSPNVARERERFRQASHTNTAGFCQWTLTWLEDGETWESIEAPTQEDHAAVLAKFKLPTRPDGPE